jgi:hypothetical protein
MEWLTRIETLCCPEQQEKTKVDQTEGTEVEQKERTEVELEGAPEIEVKMISRQRFTIAGMIRFIWKIPPINKHAKAAMGEVQVRVGSKSPTETGDFDSDPAVSVLPLSLLQIPQCRGGVVSHVNNRSDPICVEPVQVGQRSGDTKHTVLPAEISNRSYGFRNNSDVTERVTRSKIYIIPDSKSSDAIIEKFNLKLGYIGGSEFFLNEDSSFLLLVIRFAEVDFVPNFLGHFSAKITVVFVEPGRSRFGVTVQIFEMIKSTTGSRHPVSFDTAANLIGNG